MLSQSRAEKSLDRLSRVSHSLRRLLLARRNREGWWEGHLSASALSTATASFALLQSLPTVRDAEAAAVRRRLVHRGLSWLVSHQNEDGGWGDTVLSSSNISTTMLVNAALTAAVRDGSGGGDDQSFQSAIDRSQGFIAEAGGVDAVVSRYGSDQTFSVPILTQCALAGTVDWSEVSALPFELACLPARFYAALRLPVVSYALPALIAIGQVCFRKRGTWNPLAWIVRRLSIKRTLKVLERIQPPNGGFLEATPLTSFVCMSLLGCDLADHPVTQRCLGFIEQSVREDGSWPIDTNLATWVTTLSINALMYETRGKSKSIEPNNPFPMVQGGLETIPNVGPTLMHGENHSISDSTDWSREPIRQWLLKQQYRTRHPYTNAAPGGWAWTDLPGGVPDADDTPGAMLALLNMRSPQESWTAGEVDALRLAAGWLLSLQNSDGGWPTFCRGWGRLPFDRSSNDISAHVMRALWRWVHSSPGITEDSRRRVTRAIDRGLRFLTANQCADGTWKPLWFGHQFNQQDENPLYGTSRVVLSLDEIGQRDLPICKDAVKWLIENQNTDGGWSAAKGLRSSVEETGLAIEALAGFPDASESVSNGIDWLHSQIKSGGISRPTPIGFYFAKLWYFEE
ncbi:MAG: squalene--hopene cyclase, partial [Planctomycetaceae bacterium]|nr:squalene--hopene cyclase [Planctomycetaceae bacterium]